MRLHLLCLPSVALILSACSAFTPERRAIAPQAAAASPITAQNEASLYLNLVDGLLKQERFGAALAFLDGYAGKQKDVPPRYWLMRGNALLGLDRNAEAADAYARLASTPLAADGWNGRGRVAASRKQWHGAADQFRKAVQASPANAEFLNNLAYSGIQLGDVGMSITTLRQAYELDPASSLIRNNLIIALTMSGDSIGAGKLMQTITDPRRRQDIDAMIRKVTRNKKESG